MNNQWDERMINWMNPSGDSIYSNWHLFWITPPRDCFHAKSRGISLNGQTADVSCSEIPIRNLQIPTQFHYQAYNESITSKNSCKMIQTPLFEGEDNVKVRKQRLNEKCWRRNKVDLKSNKILSCFLYLNDSEI